MGGRSVIQLESLDLFSGLAEPTLEQLRSAFRAVSYTAKAAFVLEGDASRRVYVLLTGLCRVWCTTPDGREITFEILGPGEFIGELSVASEPSRSASVESLGHVTLLAADIDRFREILLADAELSFRILGVLANRLRIANTRIVALACESARQRVISSLIHVAEDHGLRTAEGRTSIPFRLTQADIGKIAGASRETCVGVLRELQERNALSRVDGHMELDLALLTRLL
jgi:CRP/FNR family transcriptional regulator, cyclic AMP receptor protein